tara:strand:- start:6767 stop:7606 length:840 start_codon:yes stop_codon:yes gene_type:complete
VLKRKIKIRDTSFKHCLYSNNPLPPVSFCEHFEWDWSTSPPDKNEVVFYTDGKLEEGVKDSTGTKICWLLEPLEVLPNSYARILHYHTSFKYVFTHEKELLNLGKNFRYVPFGGCWIKDEDQKVHDKTKLVSIIASSKNYLTGHKLRHDVVSAYGSVMDVLGNGYTSIPEKIDGLRDYMFSVVIENCKRDYFFTEKLIDTLITGTVPIYWGCPSIGDFFNTKGFIVTDSLDDVGKALSNLSPEMYREMLPYITENQEKAKNYILAENYIFDNYLETGEL